MVQYKFRFLFLAAEPCLATWTIKRLWIKRITNITNALPAEHFTSKAWYFARTKVYIQNGLVYKALFMNWTNFKHTFTLDVNMLSHSGIVTLQQFQLKGLKESEKRKKTNGKITPLKVSLIKYIFCYEAKRNWKSTLCSIWNYDKFRIFQIDTWRHFHFKGCIYGLKYPLSSYYKAIQLIH